MFGPETDPLDSSLSKNPLHIGIGWVRAQRDMMESDEDAVEDLCVRLYRVVLQKCGSEADNNPFCSCSTQSEVVALVDLEHEVPADEIKALVSVTRPVVQ